MGVPPEVSVTQDFSPTTPFSNAESQPSRAALPKNTAVYATSLAPSSE